MTPDNLKDLYIHQLRDLYSAETQLLDALPTMEEKATNPQLKQAFRDHLGTTRIQRDRLQQIFDRLDADPSGETCQAMKGIIKEAKSFIDETHNFIGSDSPSDVIDAGLIAQAQRVEHYEIAGYGTVASYADTLGLTDDKNLLGQTLDEEKHTDEELTRIAESVVNAQAVA